MVYRGMGTDVTRRGPYKFIILAEAFCGSPGVVVRNQWRGMPARISHNFENEIAKNSLKMKLRKPYSKWIDARKIFRNMSID